MDCAFNMFVWLFLVFMGHWSIVSAGFFSAMIRTSSGEDLLWFLCLCCSYAYAVVIPNAKEINSCGVQRTMEHAWVVSMFYSQRHMPCQKKVIRNMFKQYESSHQCQDQDSGLRSLKKVMLNPMEKENHLPHLGGLAILVQDKNMDSS